MFVAVAIVFPVVLLLAVLGMERVEHRLNASARPAAADPETASPAERRDALAAAGGEPERRS